MAQCVDTLVGMQWGSEGKGKIVAYIGNEYGACVRSGGSQAGHTFYYEGQKFINRQVPCAVVSPSCRLYLAPNAVVDVDVLAREVKAWNLDERLKVDRRAVVVQNAHVNSEKHLALDARIGSTLQGVGAALACKVLCQAELFGEYAQRTGHLKNLGADVAFELHELMLSGINILLEGSQGFGLSLNFGSYPFVTGRDVTSAALLSDAGIPPKYHRTCIGVMRTYPIRTGGNSGSTDSLELSWAEIAVRSKSSAPVEEYTSVTKRLRRVFEQNWDILQKSVAINGIDGVALTFLDYINHEDYGKNSFRSLSPQSREYVARVEHTLNVPVWFVSTGPLHEHLIDLRG
ncbi:adenylosuccinate synthetase [Candidatus Woesearchaeota archaeon]|nr:adenylosuccinate synthetase [Candidatus Woesearchaeota archaeon]